MQKTSAWIDAEINLIDKHGQIIKKCKLVRIKIQGPTKSKPGHRGRKKIRTKIPRGIHKKPRHKDESGVPRGPKDGD